MVQGLGEEPYRSGHRPACAGEWKLKVTYNIEEYGAWGYLKEERCGYRGRDFKA